MVSYLILKTVLTFLLRFPFLAGGEGEENNLRGEGCLLLATIQLRQVTCGMELLRTGYLWHVLFKLLNSLVIDSVRCNIESREVR